MTTNFNDVAFKESVTAVVYVINEVIGQSNVEADELQMVDNGVMIKRTQSGTVFTLFIPYTNIKEIRQSESA
jgi:hypothetical protein